MGRNGPNKRNLSFRRRTRTEYMLLGQFEGKLGIQGRVALPKKFRDTLGDKLIITKGYEKSLIIVSVEGWKTLLEGTEGKPFIHEDARQTQRFLLGGATAVELDSKGRLIIPSYLRGFAKIGTEVVFVGLSRFIEVWDKKRWTQYEGILEGTIGAISKRLIKEGEKV